MSGVRRHFCAVVVSGAGGGSRPRKYGIWGCIPADVKSDVEQKVAAVKDALKTDDTEKIKSAAEALRQSSTKIGEAMYKADQAQQAQSPDGQTEQEPAGATAGADGKKDDTIEGEFKEQS